MAILNSSGKSSSLPKDQPEQIWMLLEQEGSSDALLSPAHKDQMARAFAPRIKVIALHLKAKLPAHIDLADLISAGSLGLMEAFAKFQPSMGVRFESFAENRIRGAMLDELRRMDWLSRGLRQKIKKLELVIREFKQSNGYAPSRAELESLTGQDQSELESTLEALNSQIVLSLEAVHENFIDSDPEHDFKEPFAAVAFQDIIDKLGHLINKLNEREQLVLSLYYSEELNMKEIALTLDVTEGRISQIHSQALAKIKKMYMQQHGDLVHPL
ncbi:MAG: FliA/WhiG family RNA polymerase sigma factor [Desulfovibrionales bacterium]|nr:FliA/WhiG family RNA polymerase sigma factor [Desulfovibrionales bacterium]